MSLISKPHDKFFKETLSDINAAKNFLINYLPPDILQITDLETLSSEKDSYIEKELEETFSDLLFKANINNEESYLYFLFEHKSYPSEKVSLQLLKYIIKIWEQKTDKQNKSKIPLVIPMVFYHGKAKWKAPLNLSSLIESYDEIPKEIHKYIPDFEYILYDISGYTDEDIKGNAKLRIFLKIIRDVFEKDYDTFIETLREAIVTLDKIDKQEKGMDYFLTFIKYIMNVRDDIDIENVFKLAKEVSIERSEEIMTIAQKLIKEGMEKGIEKGIEKGMKQGIEKGMHEGIKKGINQGIEKGELKGKIAVAKNLLSLNVELDKIIKATGLSKDEIKKLMN